MRAIKHTLMSDSDRENDHLYAADGVNSLRTDSTVGLNQETITAQTPTSPTGAVCSMPKWTVQGVHMVHKYAEPVMVDITISNGGRYCTWLPVAWLAFKF